MVADGHEVVNYCAGAFMGGHDGNWNNSKITVVGSGANDDRWGNRSIGEIVNWFQPGLILTWLDIHGMNAYGWQTQPTYMWAPIDTHPVPKVEASILRRAAKVLACSRWGQEVLEADGFQSDYVPCAIDLNHFTINPEGRKNWRAQMRPEVDDETFVIGMVGLNTGMPDRKGYGFAFDVIRAFVDNHPDDKIRVYIHTDPYGDGNSLPLIDLRDHLKLTDIVAFSPPQLPWGMSDKYMRDMYCAFDVLLHTATSEGFGVPVVEAQACGVPVVASACSSVTELVTEGYTAKYASDFWINTISRIYLPDVRSLTLMLETAYADWKTGRVDHDAIRRSVMQYDQDAVYDTYWRPLLANVPAPLDFEEAGAKAGSKLLMAAGSERKDGFVHHDKDFLWEHIDIAFDMTVFPWPVEDDAYGYVELSDVLEHLKSDLTDIMDELWRITRPGGYVYIHTAEAGTWQLMKDPTHVQGFWPTSMNYFDPETMEGAHYHYSQKAWKVHKATSDAGGLIFVMAPRKDADRTNGHRPERELAEATA